MSESESTPIRPKRKASVVVNYNEAAQAKRARSFHDWWAAWKSFAPKEIDEGAERDTDSVTAVTLLVKQRTGRLKAYAGESGDGGHAEVKAIGTYLTAINYDDGAFSAAVGLGIKVKCEKKPCCVRCSALLGALGIGGTDLTFKTRETMEMTNWVLPATTKTFVREHLTVLDKDIDNLCDSKAWIG